MCHSLKYKVGYGDKLTLSFTFSLIDDLLLQLCDLYENDSIFDKFECCLSGDGQRVATGSYRYE